MEMLINGKTAVAADDGWIEVKNPATGELVDRVPRGGKDDVAAAVEAADACFGAWSEKTMRDRGLVLARAAELIRRDHKALAELLTREQGKPIREATDEVRGCANILEYYASIAGQPAGEVVSLGKAGDCLVTRVPLGVCGAIIPWNMPVIIMGWKVGPALLAGNTLVLKPASTTPLTNLKIAGLLQEAGLPPGALNVVTGAGETAGEALVTHPRVKKISFTGNCATGHRVRTLAGEQLKALTLELGGSDPMIVMPDADIPKAVEGAFRGRFYNAGQICTAVKRLYLHEKIAGEFMRLLTAKVEGTNIGNGLAPVTEMGPLNSAGQRDRIAGVMQDVVDRQEGCVLTGGGPVTGKAYENGFFYRPTLVADVPADAALLRKEIFGPVLPVITVPDLSTAIREANRSQYGLGASVWSRDLSTVKEVFGQVHAGIIWVNRHLTVPPEVPFGGTNESGMGRENGFHAIDSYTQTKTLFLGW
ncbi:aldehyde dehydrogenase family protein [Methanoregula sp.]|uniref:aldehyde dehydrogenase family protein n=1 Tax=Methanoregula sp. TaxID=2052170 RepID=UPI002BDF39DF|nr:aldehyde dehydrogenase family protein [Methanoregula sp.]HVP96129.1 aldehyde dehydrogenase family protein [Methanoregula sp.]